MGVDLGRMGRVREEENVEQLSLRRRGSEVGEWESVRENNGCDKVAPLFPDPISAILVRQVDFEDESAVTTYLL